MLTQRAHLGAPLTDHYDKKELHETYRFSYGHEPEVVVWRVRKSDVRICFIYLPKKIILVVKILSKRENKLSNSECEEIKRIGTEVLVQLDDSPFEDGVIV